MDANMVLMTINDKIPQESLPLVQSKLKEVSEDKAASLATIPYKSPIIGLILGFFFGMLGVDRFYKGDIMLAIAKFATLVIGSITILIFIGYFILFLLWVWAVVDLFLVWKGIKKDNLNKILLVLN